MGETAWRQGAVRIMVKDAGFHPYSCGNVTLFIETLTYILVKLKNDNKKMKTGEMTEQKTCCSSRGSKLGPVPSSKEFSAPFWSPQVLSPIWYTYIHSVTHMHLK